jgi:hypothetical protein
MNLPHPKDDTDSNTLPDPELNPLLNPLLSANMGRWAEVYFTAPPDKREQAVAELIHELENNSSAEPASMQAVHSQIIESGQEQEMRRNPEPPEISHSEQHLRLCVACGYENTTEQNFCGMCGSQMQVPPESYWPRPAEDAPAETDWRESESSMGQDPPVSATDEGLNFPVQAEDREIEDSSWSPRENDLPSLAMEPEPVPYRYRLYVGMVLAVLLVVLIYMSWRGAKAISGTSGPPAAPARVIPAAPAPARAEQSPAPPPTSGERAAANSTAAAPRRNPREPAPPKKPPNEAEPASRIVTKAASTAAIATEPSGADDMATAEKYLSGTQGMRRDSREAVSWLWKAVGKGNGAATIALSDLYLRGDGVPKSCDQARLLLDAAARKGQHAAAERIRNLQAFGCQ